MSEKSELKRKLKRINTLLTKAESIFSEINGGIQNEIHEVHNEGCSLNHCLRWGLQASKEVLEKKTFNKIVEHYL